MKTVTVQYAPADSIRTILLPTWVGSVQIEPQYDSRHCCSNMIEIVATRRFKQEQWLAVPVAGDESTLCAFVLMGGGNKTVEENQV